MDPVLTRILEELLRQRKDWQWFYTALGYTKQRVGGWKRRGVPPGEYEAIADVLGRSVDWVIRGVDAGGPEPSRSVKASASDSPPLPVQNYSDTKMALAPVVAWARLGTDLYKGNDDFSLASERLPFRTTKQVGRNCKFVRLESDNHAPRILPGDMILIDPDNKTPAMDELALFSMPNGDHVLLRFRETTDGYEGYDERGRVLDKNRHGIRIAGVFVLFLRENA